MSFPNIFLTGLLTLGINAVYLPSTAFAVLSTTKTTITSVGGAVGLLGGKSWEKRVFFDTNNDRWHVIYIDSGSDAHSASTDVDDGTTWTDGTDIFAGTYNYEDFDCVFDDDGGTSYLHCVISVPSGTTLSYVRCSLTAVSPYISCGAAETPYTAADANDDVALPSIVLDSNRCVLIAFDLEDDSEIVAGDEHELLLIKEDDDTTCGDGDFDGADTETGFPIESVQTEFGYNTDFPLTITSYGDLDAQLSWLDTDTSGAEDFETVHFDGDTNTIGTQRTLDDDLEPTGNATVIFGSTVINFGEDDTTTDMDAYIITTKDGTLSSQVDTGLNAILDWFQQVTAAVDTRATGANDVWVFGVNPADASDIYYAVSTDGGSNWDVQVLFADEAAAAGEAIVNMSAAFNSENCDILLSWLEYHTLTDNIDIVTQAINTGSCARSGPLKGAIIIVQ